MKMRNARKQTLLAMFTLFAILVIIVFSSVPWKSAAVASSKSTLASHQQSGNATHLHHQSAGTIDGSVDPTQIPDNKAYSLLFRLLSTRYQEREKIIRSFIKQTGVKGDDVETLIATSKAFNQQVSLLDYQAVEIHQQYGSSLNLEARDQLVALKMQREVIASTMISSLPERLSGESLKNLRQYMNDRFKRHMKIVPVTTDGHK